LAHSGRATAPQTRTPSASASACRAKAKARREAHKAAHTAEFLKIESEFNQVMRYGREVLRLAEGVNFDDDEIAIMKDTSGKVRAQLRMIDELVLNRPDDANIDDELQRMTEEQS
jgi:hypothetical protein